MQRLLGLPSATCPVARTALASIRVRYGWTDPIMAFPVGTHVLVAHGVRGWVGVVTASQPGYLTVGYPNGDIPGDEYPTRELVDLSRHSVKEVV
jgi:uncharacterized protein YijF (DUF1287 family)